MLTLKQITEDPQGIIRRLSIKGFDAQEIIDQVLSLDNMRREAQQAMDKTLAEQNSLSKEIGLLMRNGDKAKAEEMKALVATLKERGGLEEEQKTTAERQMHELLLSVPNVPSELVPMGKSAEENETIAQGGIMPDLSNQKLPHWDLCKRYNLVDFDLGVKIAGSGFPVYKGKGARLQRALINFFLDHAQQAGYLEVQPPYLVNELSGYGTGNLPDKEGQMYHVGLDNLYLIPTAEIPITNLYRDMILEEKDLPIRNTAYSACFRREAGSYGKDVRGLNRLHQFDKVEIVCVDKPESSYQRLDEMVAYVQNLIEQLDLPWRILKLCGGDISFTSALTYDFEVYSAGQERWLEVSSVSNFESYQANRLRCRYKDTKTKRTELCHTLNGSAMALPRIVAALLENNQTPKGIHIPKVLIPYTGFDIIN